VVLHELCVDRNLISSREAIGFVRHANDCHQFVEHCIGHALVARGCRVGCDAISTLIGHTDRNVNQFFRERIEDAGRHDLLDAFPSALERNGIIGECLPEIIDPVGLSGSHDVVVDGADLGRGILVFDESSRHVFSPKP